MATRAVDLVLTGHNHDLFINFDGRNAVVESSFDAHYVTAIDVTIDVNERGRPPRDDLVAAVPRHRHRDGDARPGRRGIVAGYERQLNPRDGHAARHHRRRARQPHRHVRTREAAIGNLVADAMRATMHADVAMINGGGIRGGQDLSRRARPITRRDILAELPFGNRVIAVEISGAALKQAIENGISLLPDRRRALSAGFRPDDRGRYRAAGRKPRPLDQGRRRAARRDPVYRVATNDFMARGGDGYDQFRDAIHVLADGDSPVLADEVMHYLQTAGTVRTGSRDASWCGSAGE